MVIRMGTVVAVSRLRIGPARHVVLAMTPDRMLWVRRVGGRRQSDDKQSGQYEKTLHYIPFLMSTVSGKLTPTNGLTSSITV